MKDNMLEILPALIRGAGMTLKVFLFTLLGSIPLGIIIAFLLQSSFKPLRYLIILYIWLMSGTP
ncbi:amino acid ABC transporter permease, partial [Enterococcus faecalis]|nr:amino acid ABC transporter permease [Enterococcus faecalis]